MCQHQSLSSNRHYDAILFKLESTSESESEGWLVPEHMDTALLEVTAVQIARVAELACNASLQKANTIVSFHQ